MLKRGVYAASLSVLNKDLTLNVEATITHGENLIKNGCTGVFFMGSTGQAQLCSVESKKELISKIASHKLRKQFFIGLGVNSLSDSISLIKYANEYEINKEILIGAPAYYRNNSNQVVLNFFQKIITECPKVKVVIYNFEKLFHYKFSVEAVTNLVNAFPRNIIGVKDSSYNLFENLKIKDFLVFPGSEAKLLKGLENGCAGCISAVTNVTHSLDRKVFDDF